MDTPEPAQPNDNAPTPAPQADSELAVQLRELKEAITSLPGKLAATVTDDDKRGIAESVYDLFDSGGAFERAEAEKEKKTQPEVTHEEVAEPKPQKHGKLAGFASWFAGGEK